MGSNNVKPMTGPGSSDRNEEFGGISDERLGIRVTERGELDSCETSDERSLFGNIQSPAEKMIVSVHGVIECDY